MKKFILIFLISIFSYTNSFALSKKGEKEMYGWCYPEALHLGKKSGVPELKLIRHKA